MSLEDTEGKLLDNAVEESKKKRLIITDGKDGSKQKEQPYM